MANNFYYSLKISEVSIILCPCYFLIICTESDEIIFVGHQDNIVEHILRSRTYTNH